MTLSATTVARMDMRKMSAQSFEINLRQLRLRVTTRAKARRSSMAPITTVVNLATKRPIAGRSILKRNT